VFQILLAVHNVRDAFARMGMNDSQTFALVGVAMPLENLMVHVQMDLEFRHCMIQTILGLGHAALEKVMTHSQVALRVLGQQIRLNGTMSSTRFLSKTSGRST